MSAEEPEKSKDDIIEKKWKQGKVSFFCWNLKINESRFHLANRKYAWLSSVFYYLDWVYKASLEASLSITDFPREDDVVWKNNK